MLSTYACRPFYQESVYSVLARIRAQIGTASSFYVFKELTGSRGYRAASGLPTRLERLASKLAIPGGADYLAKNHTHFNLYGHFLTELRREFLLEAMYGYGSPKSRLGILASRVSSREILKYCPECVRDDVRGKGVALWHRGHLAIGAYFCYRHSKRLMLLDDELKNTSRHLMLPPCRTVPSESKEDCLSDRRLSFISRQIQTLLERKPSTSIGVAVYKTLLVERNLASRTGRVNQIELTKLVRDWLKPLLAFPEFKQMNDDLAKERSWLADLVSGDDSFHHPLKHLVLWGAISSNASEALYSASQHGEQLGFDFNACQKVQFSKEQLAVAFKQKGTLRGAAFELGIDPTTASVYAELYGIDYRKRPKKIDQQLRDCIYEMRLSGNSSATIAAKAGISVSSVNRVLRAQLKEKTNQ